MTAEPSVHTPSSRSTAPGAGGPGRPPLMRSSWACRYSAGVPVSIQYDVVWSGIERARLDDRGERLAFDRHPTSRRDAIEHRGLQHVGTGVDVVRGRVARPGLLDERHHPSVVIGGYDAEARRIVDLGEMNGGFGPAHVVERDQRADVEVGEHVAVHHEKALVDPDVAGREPDGAGGVERLGLDRVGAASPRRSVRRGRR